MGFKSFLHRTVLRFDDGITCIVGPNGCGKSNIVDAITWVLGERGTKSLRVKDMGDVIFHGSNGRRPVNLGEVTIELQDGDQDFSVRRRIYRDGVNEYFLNGSQVRLKDVQDFFLGTGIGVNTYAIVEQGRIEQFITMKPQERRLLVEEASGITRFEEKKREALARMEEVRAGLERVEDIQSEVEGAFLKAADEWERYKQYKALSERLAEVELEILADGWRRIRKRVDRLEEKRREAAALRAGIDGALETVGREIALKEEEFGLADKVIRELEVNLKALEKDLEGKLSDMEHVRQQEAMLGQEMKTLLEERRAMQEKQERLSAEARDLKAKQAEAVVQRTAAEQRASALKERMEALAGRLSGSERAVEGARERLFVATTAVAEATNRIAEADRRASERLKREEARLRQRALVEERIGSIEKDLTPRKELCSELEQACRDLKIAEADLTGTRDSLQAELNEGRRALTEVSAALKVKEALLHQAGVDTPGKKTGAGGGTRLMDLIAFRDDFEKSLERFYVREMEYRVVEGIEGSDGEAIAKVVEGRQANYVFFPPKGTFARDAGRVRLVGAVQVGSIREAFERLWRGEEGVFAAGDVLVDSRGFILAEREDRDRAIERFASRLKLEREAKKLVKDLAGLTAAVDELASRLAVARQACSEASAARQGKERALEKVEREIIALTTELRTQGAALKNLDAARDLDVERGDEGRERLVDTLSAARQGREAAEEALKAARAEQEEIKGAHEEERGRWHRLSVELERIKGALSGLSGDLGRREEEVLALTRDAVRREERIRVIEEGMEERLLRQKALDREYDALKLALDGEAGRYEALKGNLADLHMERAALGEKRQGLVAERERLRSREEQVDKDLAVFTEKAGVIEDRLRTVYGIEDMEGMAPPVIKAPEEERDTLQRRIRELGEINFRAEKEHGELAERREFLGRQRADLEEGMDALRKTISRIELLSRDKFLETFERISGAFKRYVPLLFKGGRGHLDLSSDTGGVELYAQPPGKRVVRMELLSGGEKALVSLSFLLSLMDTRPSPFSLLDEIDAPLDDANLMGLMEIMRDMSRKTQILFITHNRITMTSSDALYGVTMEEDGVSKIVSVRL
jgi:chromosome segregation protein